MKSTERIVGNINPARAAYLACIHAIGDMEH
jgi:hypothetical protein